MFFCIFANYIYKIEYMLKDMKWTGVAMRVLFFTLTVAIILFFSPREAKYQYQFEIGKPWQYELLTADFDFPIYKDKDEFRQEREQVLDNKVLYFSSSASTESYAINAVTSEIHRMAKECQSATVKTNETIHFAEKAELYIAYLTKEMRMIYKAGLMADADYSAVKENASDHVVIIDRNNMGKPQSKENLYSVGRARVVIFNNLPASLEQVWIEEIDITRFMVPNLSYNEEITDKVLAEEYKNVSATQGMVQRGERIIDKGEIVTAQKLKILNSLKQETINRNITSQQQFYSALSGNMLLICIMLGIFFAYTILFRKQYSNSARYFALTTTLISIYYIATSLIAQYTTPSFVYMIPYALVPIILTTFYDARTAFFTHTIMILLCSTMVSGPLEYILLEIPAGMMATLVTKNIENRSQLVRGALIIFATYCTIYFAHGLMLDGDIVVVSKWTFLWFVINGMFLLFAYPFIFVIEKVFGFTSNVTLLELSNTNNPLLRRLSEEAPGTFQHSLQVSNIAADVASELGANALLARTGALYHDIGKMKNPAFFTENQHNGINPHSQLTPEQSAHIIINHIKDGVEMAHQATLPESIIGIIKTHHGKSKTKYFYNTWVNNNPDKIVDESKFMYDGPNPETVEQGIIMICDAIEAASRSLPEYTDEAIGGLVNKIVNGIMEEHYLDNTPIKMNQISQIKTLLIEKLKTIYHTRIAYPELKNQKK